MESFKPATAFGLALLALAALTGCATQKPQAVYDVDAPRPNIIVVLVDDMGYSDIGCYGGEVETPNLDALAQGGVSYSQFYNAARCCPTRASLLTGLYPHQTGIGFMASADFGKPGYRADLNDRCVTLAEALAPVGYRTYMAGKWHVCRDFAPDGPQHNWPLQRGFDRFYGTLIAAGSQWGPTTLMEGNETAVPEGDYYYTEVLTDKAIEYIDEGDEEDPFFLYLAYTAPHWPLHAREEAIEKYRGRYAQGWDVLRQQRYDRLVELGLIRADWDLPQRDEKVPAWEDVEHQQWEQTRMEAYAAMIDQVDQNLGRLTKHLEEKGELDNTLILFLSDNGGDSLEHPNGMIGSTGKPWAIMRYVPLYTNDGRAVLAGDVPGLNLGPDTTYGGYGVKWAHLSDTPFRKFKTYIHEGGISTPMIAHWPDGIAQPGRIEHSTGHVIDIMATCLDVAGATYPRTYNGHAITRLEGASMVPVMVGGAAPSRPLFWEHRGNRGARIGDWKIVAQTDGEWHLYNMDADRTETTDLAEEHPEIVERMAGAYDRWAQRCDVLPWAQVNPSASGPIIPDKDNPLVRSPEEMAEYYQALKDAEVDLPPDLERFLPE